MTDRLKSLRRLFRVQDQVKRLAEWDLMNAESRKAEAEAAERILDAFIGEGSQSTRLISAALSHRRTLSVQHGAAERELAIQSHATREARSRARLAERMVEDLDRVEERLKERKDLERLLDSMAGRDTDPDASLR